MSSETEPILLEQCGGLNRKQVVTTRSCILISLKDKTEYPFSSFADADAFLDRKHGYVSGKVRDNKNPSCVHDDGTIELFDMFVHLVEHAVRQNRMLLNRAGIVKNVMAIVVGLAVLHLYQGGKQNLVIRMEILLTAFNIAHNTIQIKRRK